MKTILFKSLLTFTVIFGLSAQGQCTQLPEPIVQFIKEKFPETNIRFDGYIELPDKTAYIPVMPVINENSDELIKIVQTIPAEIDFSQKPDMVLFSNNLALLKIIKNEGEHPTVINSNEMPLKVKLGLLPQDLVVPKGLVLPADLKVILGDLKIPLKPKTDKEGDIAFYDKTSTNDNQSEKPVSLLGKTSENTYKLSELEFLSEKNVYTINNRTNKLYILDSQSGRTLKEISLPSIPLNMVVTPDQKYLLLAGSAVNKIFVVDIIHNEFIKSIDVGQFPLSIVCSSRKQKAYVANKFSSTITEIDLLNMQVLKEIPVTGFPDSLTLSENDDFIYYNDYKLGNIYRFAPETSEATLLFQDKNVAKIGYFSRYIFSLSRSENTLTVFNLKTGKIIKKTELNTKPLDFKIIENMAKMLVVCSGSNELQIIDLENFDILKTIPLKNNGFPGKIEIVNAKAKSKAIITDFDAYEIAIYDIDMEKVDEYIPVSHIVGSIVVSD